MGGCCVKSSMAGHQAGIDGLYEDKIPYTNDDGFEFASNPQAILNNYNKQTLGSIKSTGIYSRDSSYSSQEICMDHFDIVKVIGRGSFGKVYLVKKKDDGKVFAMKTLKKDMILRKNQTENTKGKSVINS
jgi:serine/threonine protein kinase